jgi:hypothetical protein
MKRIALFFIFLFVLFFWADHFCAKKTDGFTFLGISSKRPFRKGWQSRPLTEEENGELARALAQKFTYFGCGGQCFVFFSEDQKYAIKFFKQRLYGLPLWLKIAPLPWPFHRYYAKKKFSRQDKLERDFASYKLAFDELKEESQLVYIHLNQTDSLKKEITLVDKLGIHHQLALDNVDFVIQKKADLIYPRIDQLMSEGKISESKQIIQQTLTLILTRCKKGFADRDPNIRTNCGLIGKNAVKIDVGKIVRNSAMKIPEIYKKELSRISEPFKKWIDEKHVSLSEYFEEELARLMEEEE